MLQMKLIPRFTKICIIKASKLFINFSSKITQVNKRKHTISQWDTFTNLTQ